MSDSRHRPIGTVNGVHAAFTELLQAQREHEQAMRERVAVHYTVPMTDTRPTSEDTAP